MTGTKYYLVAAEVLPEVILKVAEANRMLRSGEVRTAQEAAKAVGISRSAFYKYRDAIYPFQDLMAGRIITFQMMLRDEPGCLSSLLSIFAQFGANILTINQTIPSNGCASVTVSAETTALECTVEELLRHISELNGVLRAEILAG